MQLRTTAQNPITLETRRSFIHALGWFLLPPVTTLVIAILIGAITLVNYQGRHTNRIYTGVRIWDVDLSQMTRDEAEAALAAIFPRGREKTIYLTDPASGEEWVFAPVELGISYDVERTVEAAYAIGREGGPFRQLRDLFFSWYFGRPMAPIVVLDEGEMEAALGEIAAAVDRPAVDAQLTFNGSEVAYTRGQVGRRLDTAYLKEQLIGPLTDFREAHVELLIHEVRPQILDDGETARRVENILRSPMTFYFEEPLKDLDLGRVEVSTEQLASWLRVEMVENEQGASYRVFADENAVRHWLDEIAATIYKQPQNARFYFDDNTRELVLVEPHVNGRILNVEATLEKFLARVDSSQRSVPLVVEEIVPTVHSNVTAAELGITELITESTTWFYGSTPERKHNIARAASQFFGIVVAPGEEFSFNRYLGDVTEDAGFTTGLIILGGRTVEGVGGGVCQVSTTLYQTAFWAGFPITERLEHGYRVHYYDDGEGPGMDATVFSDPELGINVDLKFVNNTPYYLLIENYYNETYESLTFKFYSTGMGWTVDKEGPSFANEVPPKPDQWEYNEELETGEIVKVDWAVEGADVTVFRRVYDENGNMLYGEERFDSHYIPWQNIYQYGPEVDPENVDPDDIPE